MSISTIRPKVAQLTFQFFNRSLHPELFQVAKSHHIDRDIFSAIIDITHDGHVIRFSAGNTTLTEVAASVHQPLPKSRRVAAQSAQRKMLGVDRVPRWYRLSLRT